MQRGENRNVVKFSDIKSETDLKSEGAKAISISLGGLGGVTGKVYSFFFFKEEEESYRKH